MAQAKWGALQELCEEAIEQERVGKLSERASCYDMFFGVDISSGCVGVDHRQLWK
jgi:hypothetical protein